VDTKASLAGVSLSGSVLKEDEDDNRKLYGRSATAEQILVRRKVSIPPEAVARDRELSRYSLRCRRSFASLSLGRTRHPDKGEMGRDLVRTSPHLRSPTPPPRTRNVSPWPVSALRMGSRTAVSVRNAI
jgi:Las17-binding protein actin regulator